MSTADAQGRTAEQAQPTDYLCPRTGAPLRRRGATLQAEGSGPEYQVVDDIPRMLRFEPAEDEHQRAELRRLNRLSGQLGWRRAIEQVKGESDRYNLDPRRAGFLDLLRLTDRSVVLELGPALGVITEPLARRVGRVHALEVVPEQAEFTAARCRQQGLANVAVACGGDDCRLPYAGGLFDAAILNLVFEWCAHRLEGEPYLDGQRRMLAEAWRVLKPGGQLLVATKNRYSLGNLLGRRDGHAHDIRFGNALPRRLMDWRLRRMGKARPLGLLHSHGGLRRLLEEAGFVRPRSFWAAPEMRFPTDYVPTDAASVRAARRRVGFVQGELRSTRLLMKLVPDGLVKQVTPGLLFVAEKPS